MLKHLRTLGFIEAFSFLLLLFIAMPMKYLGGQPEAVRIVGSLHGFLFVAYIALAAVVASESSWPMRKTLFACFVATVPFGPFVFDKKLFPR